MLHDLISLKYWRMFEINKWQRDVLSILTRWYTNFPGDSGLVFRTSHAILSLGNRLIRILPKLCRFLTKPPLTLIWIVRFLPKMQLIQRQLDSLSRHRIIAEKYVNRFQASWHWSDVFFGEQGQSVRRTEVCRYERGTDAVHGDTVVGGKSRPAGAGETYKPRFRSRVEGVCWHGTGRHQHKMNSRHSRNVVVLNYKPAAELVITTLPPLSLFFRAYHLKSHTPWMTASKSTLKVFKFNG